MLGSGCWEGTPAPFCNCPICTAAARDMNSIEFRSRPEILVQGEGGPFLIEISPDIRLQSTTFQLPQIRDYFISHWHFDHLFGLYELDAWVDLVLKSPIRIYCSSEVGKMIEKQFGYIGSTVTVLQPYVPIEMRGITVTPLPVLHMRRAESNDAEFGMNNTFGYLLESKGQKVAYLADYYALPQRTIDLIKGADVIIADGTYLFEDRYPQKPYQIATQEEKDPDHLHGNDILTFMNTLQAKAVVYHSITHLPELQHHELQALLPKGQYIGYDGFDIDTLLHMQ